MPSPFPGMDPWLERPAVFGGVQQGLVVYLKQAVNARLPPANVAVVRHLNWTEPTLGEPREQPYLEILNVEDESPVTAVAILCPANKQPGEPGHTAHARMRNTFRATRVNFVEIDLLRGEVHTTAIPLADLRKRVLAYDYHVCVTRIEERSTFGLKPFALSDRLPSISIPLDPGVPAVKVDLQPLLARAYDTGLYSRLAKYTTKSPDPALTPDQRAWADAILKGPA